MCNVLSPERALLWAVMHAPALHEAVAGILRPEFFTHTPYRVCYTVCRDLYAAGRGAVTEDVIVQGAARQGFALAPADRRAVRRMLRVSPPARVRDNVAALAAAVADRHHGRPARLPGLIN